MGELCRWWHRALRAVIVACWLLGGSLLVTGPAPAQAQTPCLLYSAVGSQGAIGPLQVIDPNTGALVGAIGSGIGFAVTGLAVDPTTGSLYGATATRSPSNPDSLITINQTTGIGTLIGSFGVPGGFSIADMSFDPRGVLYGVDSNFTQTLYTINKATGAATPIGPVNATTSLGNAVAFSPAGPLLFSGDSTNGALRTLNLTTGNSSVVITLNNGPYGTRVRAIDAMTFDPAGTLYGLASGSAPSPGAPVATDLVVINPTTGAITVRGATVGNSDGLAFSCNTFVPAPVVPEWSPLWLFGSGLLALGLFTRLARPSRRSR